MQTKYGKHDMHVLLCFLAIPLNKQLFPKQCCRWEFGWRNSYSGMLVHNLAAGAKKLSAGQQFLFAQGCSLKVILIHNFLYYTGGHEIRTCVSWSPFGKRADLEPSRGARSANNFKLTLSVRGALSENERATMRLRAFAGPFRETSGRL